MDSGEIATAIELAREAVGAPTDLRAHTDVVHRVDTNRDYVLVRLDGGGPSSWVAAVDPRSGDVMSWALNTTGEPTTPPTRGPEQDYVWMPSSTSPSPLYPLLRIPTNTGTKYIDITGTVHHNLEGHRA